MATQTQQNRQPPPRKRVIHQLDTPFTTIVWPEINPQDQETILDLLCSLLAPIGHYRGKYVKRSKGKKRKGKAEREAADTKEDLPAPPEPPIMSYVDVGFNCITKNLQLQSQPQVNPETKTDPRRMYSVVFVARGDQSPAFNCHFPQMVGSATKIPPDGEKTRLVGFSKACSERLSLSLGVPRVSSVALVADAPGARALQAMVRSAVPAIDVQWLPTLQADGYQPSKINSIQTTVGNKKTRVA